MPDYKEILYEKRRGGALITLNRPEAMNAISRSMIKEIHQALDDVEEDKEVRAVVLTGAGQACDSSTLGISLWTTTAGRFPGSPNTTS